MYKFNPKGRVDLIKNPPNSLALESAKRRAAPQVQRLEFSAFPRLWR